MTRSAKTATIFCPVCKADTLQSVNDSRPTTFDGFAVVRRRRICEDCGGKFSTIELPTAFLDDRLLRAEIMKRIFDKVYDELTSGAPKLDRRYNMLKGDGD